MASREQQELAILVTARDLASRTIGKVNRSLSSIGRHARRGVANAVSNLAKLGKIAAGVGIGIGAVAVKLAAGFESSMSQSLAIVSNVSDQMRTRMERAARDVAKSTTFSAAEAAEAYFFLASAGLDAEQMLSAMPQVAKFAQAGMFDLATATDLLTDAQSALGLKSADAGKNLKNMTKLSDQLVKANVLSNATVQEFSEALTTKAGAAMRKFGMDSAEGLGVLAVFADAGVKGNRAGTVFTSMLTGLTNAATKNERQFAKLGLRIFDANGELRPMTDITRDLTRVFGDMTDEQRTAAFQQLGINRLTASGVDLMLGQEQAQRKYEKALRQSGGTTDEVANKQLKSFSAQLSILRSHLEDIGITLGSALLPGLTRVTSKFSEFLGSPEGQRAVESFAKKLERGFNRAIRKGEEFLTGLDWAAITANLGTIGGAFADLGKELGPSVVEALKSMPWALIGESATILATGAKEALRLFNEAPDWLKTAIVTGWGLNKLTGGAFGSIVSELGKGLIKGVLGLTAGVVNIMAGAVKGPGGIPAPVVAGGSRVGGMAGAALGATAVLAPPAIAGLVIGELTKDDVHDAVRDGVVAAGPLQAPLEQGLNTQAGLVRIQQDIVGGVADFLRLRDDENRRNEQLAAIDGRLVELRDQGSRSARDEVFLLELQKQAIETGNLDLATKIGNGTLKLQDLRAGLVPEVQAMRRGTVATTDAVRDVRTAVNAQQLSVAVNTTVSTRISARDVAAETTRTYIRVGGR